MRARNIRRRRRIATSAAITVIFTAGAAGLSATASGTPTSGTPALQAGTNQFDNALIAKTALRYVGQWGGQACADAKHDLSGQCRQFVNCIVALATGGHVYPVDGTGDYQKGFAEHGGVEVTSAAAVEGDIIQVGDHDDDTVLHTAIVLANHHDGTFTVVDANWVGNPVTPELVGVHDYSPPAAARFWRLGTAFDNTGQSTATHGKNKTGTVLTAPQPPKLTIDTPAAIAAGTVVIHIDDADPHRHATTVRFWLDDKPVATQRADATGTTLRLDTTGLTDGPHRLAAQAITPDGAISPLSNDVVLTVANTHLTVLSSIPAAPLASGTIPVTAFAAPAAGLGNFTVAVDGQDKVTGPASAGNTLMLDTRTLTVGPHQITVTVSDSAGDFASAAPMAITVTGAVTGDRVAIPSATAGHTDLAAVDPTGALLRYPWVGDAAFGAPQTLSTDFANTTLLAAGNFTGDHLTHLVAVKQDGSARIYSLDATGKLSDGVAVTGPHWSTYTRLVAQKPTGSGPDQLIGITASGHADLITIAASGHRATTKATTAPAAITPAPPAAAAPAAASPNGAPAPAVPTVAAAPGSTPAPAAPAVAAPIVVGAFGSQDVDLLITDADGITVLQPIGAKDSASNRPVAFDQVAVRRPQGRLTELE